MRRSTDRCTEVELAWVRLGVGDQFEMLYIGICALMARTSGAVEIREIGAKLLMGSYPASWYSWGLIESAPEVASIKE